MTKKRRVLRKGKKHREAVAARKAREEHLHHIKLVTEIVGYWLKNQPEIAREVEERIVRHLDSPNVHNALYADLWELCLGLQERASDTEFSILVKNVVNAARWDLLAARFVEHKRSVDSDKETT